MDRGAGTEQRTTEPQRSFGMSNRLKKLFAEYGGRILVCAGILCMVLLFILYMWIWLTTDPVIDIIHPEGILYYQTNSLYPISPS